MFALLLVILIAVLERRLLSREIDAECTFPSKYCVFVDAFYRFSSMNKGLTSVDEPTAGASSQVNFVGLDTARPRLGPYGGSGDHNYKTTSL